MYSLQNLMSQQKTEHLQAVIDSIPACIYWKDQNGKYLGINSHSITFTKELNIKTQGFDNVNSIIDKTDFHIYPKESAIQYIHNDQVIMKSEKTLTFEEKILNRDNQPILQLSTKCPLYDSKGNVAGVIGNTMHITNHARFDKWQDNIPANLKQMSQKLQVRHKDTKAIVVLSPSLKICLIEILQGRTAKQIGKNLSLSYRTIEHYTAKIKKLLGCSSTKELVLFYFSQIDAIYK